MHSMPYSAIHVGHVFGRWTVISDPVVGHPRPRVLAVSFHCRCACGTQRLVPYQGLRYGRSTSCGCLRDEITSAVNSRHQESKTPLYGVWLNMRSRCADPTDEAYHNYGGRGITVCPEWAAPTSYPVFRDWARANGYERGLELDRKDNNAGYSPINCHWTTTRENNRNRRNNLRFTVWGETKTLVEWSEDPRCLVVYACLRDRIIRGWPGEKALTRSSWRHR